MIARLRRSQGWPKTIARNTWYQDNVLKQLVRMDDKVDAFFSYSYSALGLLPLCRDRGWMSVVGQIDPGPVEERIVAEEHDRYPQIASSWNHAPKRYWDAWQQEMELADRIVVNSAWSRRCLVEEGIDERKISIIPLVYQPSNVHAHPVNQRTINSKMSNDTFNVLFLGQVNLRKGIARLIHAMRQLKSHPEIRLTIAGPSEVSSQLWDDLQNVQYLGPVRRSHVAKLYRAADVFILPTLSDGYALTQLEALAEGVPVIASKRCGDCVVEGENGWRLPDLEPNTIAEAIVHAKEHRLDFEPPSAFGIESYAKRLAELATSFQ
ncbi:glycosyltransferase family 4 protein [Novipirellula caenicola]